MIYALVAFWYNVAIYAYFQARNLGSQAPKTIMQPWSLALELSIELWIGHRLEDWQRIDIWLVMKADWIGEWPLD